MGQQKGLRRAAAEDVDPPGSTRKIRKRELRIERGRMTYDDEGTHATMVLGPAWGDQQGAHTGHMAAVGMPPPVRLETRMHTLRLAMLFMCCFGAMAAATEVAAHIGTLWEPGLLPGWDLHGAIQIGPAQLGLVALGEGDRPAWAKGRASFSGGGLTGGWQTWWDPDAPSLRYVQLEFGVAAGGHTARNVWVWADDAGTGSLSWGSWLRLGWPEDAPAGWSASLDLGASRSPLTLSRPGFWRTAKGEFTPSLDGLSLSFHQAELALWLHRWRLETTLTWPLGFEHAVLTGEVPLGWLVIHLEQKFAPYGNTLSLWPELRIASGCLVLYFDLIWSPPLVLHSAILEGVVLKGGPPGSHIELTIDLGVYDLLEEPYRVRLFVQLLREFGTAFSSLWLQQAPPLLTWGRLDLGFCVPLLPGVQLATLMSLEPDGLARFEASVQISVPSGL